MPRAPRQRGGNPPVLKKFGQHFLNDTKILTAIVDALGPTPNDVVVEIGPGRGSLTEILAGRAGRLIAVEIDRQLAEKLRGKYQDSDSVTIVEGDVLQTDLHALAGNDFLLVGNVPYYITTPIVFKALEQPMPRRSVFLVQREVGERMSAREGSESYGALSINIAAVANVECVMDVPAAAFTPPPKVTSTVVRITPRPDPLVSGAALEPFRSFVQAAFSMRRKQMNRVLRSVRGISAHESTEILRAVGIDPEVRPEVVSPRKFAQLFSFARS